MGNGYSISHPLSCSHELSERTNVLSDMQSWVLGFYYSPVLRTTAPREKWEVWSQRKEVAFPWDAKEPAHLTAKFSKWKHSRKCSRAVSGHYCRYQRGGGLGRRGNCGPDKNLSAAFPVNLSSVLYFLSTASPPFYASCLSCPLQCLGQVQSLRLLKLKSAVSNSTCISEAELHQLLSWAQAGVLTLVAGRTGETGRGCGLILWHLSLRLFSRPNFLASLVWRA